MISTLKKIMKHHKCALAAVILLNLAIAFLQPWCVKLLSSTLDKVDLLDSVSLGWALAFYCFIRIFTDVLCEAVDFGQRCYIKVLQRDFKRILNHKIRTGTYYKLQKYEKGELLTAYSLCDEILLHSILPGLQLLGFTVTFAVSCYYLYRITPKALALALLFLAVWRASVYAFHKRVHAAEAQDIAARKKYNGFVSEIVQAREEIVAWNREKISDAKIDERFRAKEAAVSKKGLFSTLCQQIDLFVSAMSVLASILITANSGVPAAQAIAIYLYISMLYKPVADMNDLVQELYGASLKMKEVACFLDMESERDGAESGGYSEGIFIPSLSVAVRGEEILRLHNISIKAHELTVLWGKSGSGKTTFINALLGFVRSTGNIYGYDQPARTVERRSIRKMSALVPQEPVLFSGSLLSNIILDQDYRKEKLTASMKLSSMNDVDLDMENPDKVEVGENGGNLSQGQRQRISIARALYADRPVIILDEPTSALDDRNAEQMVEMLKSLKRDKTLIVSTHDPRILEIADNTLCF